MEKQQDYVALDSITAVRTNPGMFIGDTETPDHLVVEVIDNMLDEIVNKYASNGDIFIDDKEGIWITDNGRGLKIGLTKDPDTGEMKDSIELLCTKLFSGSKFRQEDLVDYKIQIGMHGVGLVVVNSFSEWLVVRVKKENKIHEYVFVDSFLNSHKTRDIQESETFSTQVGFKPDPKYFDNVSIDIKSIINRLLLSQSVHDHAQFSVNEQEIPKITLYEYVRTALSLDNSVELYSVDQIVGDERLRIYLTYINARDSVIIGDVNLRTCDGTYITNTSTMIKDIINKNIGRKFKALDKKEFLTGIRCYVNLTLEKPKFDAQVKSRMKSNIRPYLQKVEKRLTKILITEHIMDTLTRLLEAKVTTKIVSRANGKRISNKNKLRDCSKSPGDVLYIVEGDSADGTLKVVRNKTNEASFPLKGKMVNVVKASSVKLSQNQEVKQLLEALGTEGRRRYKKVKLLSDSDSDGLHINLLATLFMYKFASEMIKEGRVSIILPPLYGAVKGKEFVPIYEFKDTKKYRIKKYDIKRFKGLGEMNPNQLEVVIRKGKEYIIKYPESIDLINTIVGNTDVRKKLMETNLSLKNLM